MMASIAFYSFSYAVEIYSVELDQVVSFFRVAGFWAGFTAPAYLHFVIVFLRRRSMGRVVTLIFYSIPFILGVFYLTSGYHQYMFKGYQLYEGRSFNAMVYDPAPIYWVDVVYLMAVSFLAEGLLIVRLIKSKGIIRKQIVLMIAAGLLPIISAVLYPMRTPGELINTQPFTLAVSGILLAIALFRYQILDLISVARNLAVDHMREIMILTDTRGMVIDINSSGKESDLLAHIKIGQMIPAEGILKQFLDEMLDKEGSASQEKWFQFEFRDRHYQLSQSKVRGKNKELEGFVLLIHENTRMMHLMKELERQAIYDELTKIFNRRHLLSLAERELRVARRKKQCIAFCIFDLDHFKNINDTYGHAMGDEVLERAADLVSKQIRPADIFGRYGGEEFCIVFPGTDEGGALKTVERLRKGISELQFEHNGVPFTVSASFGLYLPHSCDNLEIKESLEKADVALYKAKSSGRNRTVLLQ